MTYRSLIRQRRSLIRKLKEAREHHYPTDRIIYALQSITTEMLRAESEGLPLTAKVAT